VSSLAAAAAAVCVCPPPPGCEVVVYYNRTQSEVLRERNRIQLILGYNQWELQSEQVRGWGCCGQRRVGWGGGGAVNV
jgi:hypothetical protein